MKCVFVLSVIYFVSLKTLTISFFFWGQKFHQNFVCLLISPFNTVSLIMFFPLRTYSVSGAPHWIFLINHLGLFTLFSHISPFGLWALLWQIFLTSPHSSSAWALVCFFFHLLPDFLILSVICFISKNCRSLPNCSLFRMQPALTFRMQYPLDSLTILIRNL